MPAARRKAESAAAAHNAPTPEAAEYLHTAARERGRAGAGKFPWRAEPTWYYTLVAEVLLQHTPSARVVPVFQTVVRRWPTFASLADARPEDLEAALVPLGLQRRRAAALIAIARAVVEQWGGTPPARVEDVARLPGVGRYTAGVAVAVAGQAPAAYVDGGVARLLRRYFGLPAGGHPSTDRGAWAVADALAAGAEPRALAWGLLDLAREVCRPRPLCGECPLRARCAAVNA